MRFDIVSPQICAELAREIFEKNPGYKNKTSAALDKEICQSLIGTTYNICSELWNHIDPLHNTQLQQAHPRVNLSKAHPKHLFWALVFLKVYDTESVLTRLVGGVDNKTFRNWSWAFVDGISSLKPRVVSVKP